MSDTWTDNGFSSLEAMDTAHQHVLLLVERAFQHNPYIMVVWDLGCGNGLLLHKIKGLHPKIFAAGIDSSREKTEKGQKLYTDVRFAVHNINDVIPSGDLHIISVNRFNEDHSGRLLQNLINFGKIVIIYSYDSKPLIDITKKFLLKRFQVLANAEQGIVLTK